MAKCLIIREIHSIVTESIINNAEFKKLLIKLTSKSLIIENNSTLT